MASRSKHLTAGAGAFPQANGMQKSRVKITEQERKRFEALVKKAKTLGEVQKLEKAFAEGRLPAGVADDDAMDET